MGPSHQGVVAPEEPGRPPRRKGHLARTGDLDPRGQRVESPDDRLEHPRITRRILVEHDERGTPRLRLAAPLQALIVDSWFDNYVGVVSLVRVVNLLHCGYSPRNRQRQPEWRAPQQGLINHGIDSHI